MAGDRKWPVTGYDRIWPETGCGRGRDMAGDGIWLETGFTRERDTAGDRIWLEMGYGRRRDMARDGDASRVSSGDHGGNKRKVNRSGENEAWTRNVTEENKTGYTGLSRSKKGQKPKALQTCIRTDRRTHTLIKSLRSDQKDLNSKTKRNKETGAIERKTQ